jgi:hypothetical protein
MAGNRSEGWEKLLEGYPWFNCDNCFPLPAYSEFMPSPLVGRKPLGETDYRIFSKDDPYGWKISELEEEYELKPGIVHIGKQIMHSVVKLGHTLKENRIHGHGGKNLTGNPYWPDELVKNTGNLSHERYVALIPMMFSRTQDDKGRVTWTFFGNSIHDPEYSFWKSFYTSPGTELDSFQITGFFTDLLHKVYGMDLTDERSLLSSGFRILPVNSDSSLPVWTSGFIVNDNSDFSNVKFLLTFRPFSQLPPIVKDSYLSGKLNLLPFPGSLVFWGMPTYNKLKEQVPSAGQIPLQRLASRNRGIAGVRVTQSGWFHEPHPDNVKHEINEELVNNSFHRTHRWEKVHRYQDELNQEVEKVKIAKAFFSTSPDSMGLYDKPLARNCQLWDHNFKLLLNGPVAGRKEIYETEKIILGGGLFGYRFFYPPMKVGKHEVYLHRPLVAYTEKDSGNVIVLEDSLAGFITAYESTDINMSSPVELWPRIQKRELYLMAIRDFKNGHDHYSHQTSKNILSLLESWQMQNEKPLSRSLANKLLNLSKGKTLEEWIEELDNHTDNRDAARRMKKFLEKIIEPDRTASLPEHLTYSLTANRTFEEAWWNEIRFLAHGQFIYKDNADIASDDVTRSIAEKNRRDLESLGDYFLSKYRKSIADAGMEGIAFCGELPFKWQTDFEYSLYGGWTGNQKGINYERNILMVIPGKNRKEAVVFGDHYDTAYMEDIYEKGRGGSGARLAANGADDNYSASTTLLLSAPIFLKMAKEGKLERDIWLIHLTGEEFPADCMGARNFCRTVIEKNIKLRSSDGSEMDLSGTEIMGVYVMDMIGHNRDNDRDIFQISPGKSAASLGLAKEAHIANMIWNNQVHLWNRDHNRADLDRGKRISGDKDIPDPARFLPITGEVRTQFNPHSSIFNTDGQIFSDMGIPVVLFMENYDINRTGYHDTHDTMENIDLDYGAAFAAIAIETVARVAVKKGE